MSGGRWAVSGERCAVSGECCIGGSTLTAMRRECALPRLLPRKTSATAQKRHAVTSISGLQWIMKTACRGAVEVCEVCGAVEVCEVRGLLRRGMMRLSCG